jgi:small subunit ribosomal protein S20
VIDVRDHAQVANGTEVGHGTLSDTDGRNRISLVTSTASSVTGPTPGVTPPGRPAILSRSARDARGPAIDSRFNLVANIKSQIKRNRQNEKRRVRNKAVRSEMKTRTKGAAAAAESGADDVEELTRDAIQRIDKAAQKGVIHKNQAARRKSRLMRAVRSSASD